MFSLLLWLSEQGDIRRKVGALCWITTMKQEDADDFAYHSILSCDFYKTNIHWKWVNFQKAPSTRISRAWTVNFSHQSGALCPLGYQCSKIRGPVTWMLVIYWDLVRPHRLPSDVRRYSSLSECLLFCLVWCRLSKKCENPSPRPRPKVWFPYLVCYDGTRQRVLDVCCV